LRKVPFFGLLKNVCGAAEGPLEIPAGASVGFVFDHYVAAHPQLRAMASNIVIARNQEFVAGDTLLAGGDEVALLPPVSGGSTHEISDPGGHYFALIPVALIPKRVQTTLASVLPPRSCDHLNDLRSNLDVPLISIPLQWF
jgi:molybdopterin converting factor small subunit